MKKKMVTILSLAVAGLLVLGGVLITQNSNSIDVIKGEGNSYQINLTETNRLYDITSASETKDYGYAKTNRKAPIQFEFSHNALTADVGFIDFASGGGEIRNIDPINGLIKLDYKCNEDITIQYGFSATDLHYSEPLSQTGPSWGPSNRMVFKNDFGYPSYFKISCKRDVQITQLCFTYSCQGSADPFRQDGTWTYEVENVNQVRITGYSIESDKIPADGLLVVPAFIDDMHVYHINANVLNNVPWVSHIALPFIGQSYLTDGGGSLEFGSIFASDPGHINYVAVGQHSQTWYVPESLKTVTIYDANKDPDSRRKIPNYAFYGADNLTQINIIGPTTADQTTDYKVNIIGSYAFANCFGLSEIHLPTSITTVDANAFAGNTDLIIRCYGSFSTFHIDETRNPSHARVTENYVDTVEYNGIKYDLYKSGDKVYANALGVTTASGNELHLENDIVVRGKTYQCRSVANRAFENCTNYERIYLPAGMENVGHLAFKGIYRASIILGEEIDELIYQSDWDKDTGVVAPAYQGDPVDEHCNVSYLPLANGYFADYIVDSSQSVLQLDQYDTNTPIYVAAYFAEDNCTLTTLTLPKKITLGDAAFIDCENLVIVQYAGTVTEWEALVDANKIGVNVFANTKVTQIICNGGSEPVTTTLGLATI